MDSALATMLTLTTYGSWLRGDVRGWVENGKTLPADAVLESADRQRMNHPVYLFKHGQLVDVGKMIGNSLCQRLAAHVYALTVQTWHVHVVVGPSLHSTGTIVKCVKDSVRWGLRPGRPIWSTHYDKRFCFDVRSVQARIAYVQRHNAEMGLSVKAWDFIEEFTF